MFRPESCYVSCLQHTFRPSRCLMRDFHAWDDVIKPVDGDTDGFNDAPPGMFFLGGCTIDWCRIFKSQDITVNSIVRSHDAMSCSTLGRNRALVRNNNALRNPLTLRPFFVWEGNLERHGFFSETLSPDITF